MQSSMKSIKYLNSQHLSCYVHNIKTEMKHFKNRKKHFKNNLAHIFICKHDFFLKGVYLLPYVDIILIYIHCEILTY